MDKGLNFNIPCMGLDKKPLLNEDQTAQTLGVHFANVIASIQQGDARLLMSWAQSIYDGNDISVNIEQLSLLKQIASACPLPAILRHQILQIIEA